MEKSALKKEEDQLVLFNTGINIKPEEEVWEIRAAIFPTEFGKGLHYAGNCKTNQTLGNYSGLQITLEEYNNLDDNTGLRHTFKGPAKAGYYINGINGIQGMQFANTDRKSRERNNLSYSQEKATIKTTKETKAGEPCLLYYNWSRTTWNEIDSGVIGLIAFDEMERKGDQFLQSFLMILGQLYRIGHGVTVLRFPVDPRVSPNPYDSWAVCGCFFSPWAAVL